ncbi:MAG: PAS domain-containing protein [Chloroflexi bacterium]|nr:PAS domain-containing protein [Chloroflexota bacterium]
MNYDLFLLLGVTFTAALIYSALLILLAVRQRWHDSVESRFTFWIAFALLTQLVFAADYALVGVGSNSDLVPKLYFYLASALPLFFYAFASAFTSALVAPSLDGERQPWIFFPGLGALTLAVVLDLYRPVIPIGDMILSVPIIVSSLRVLLWVVPTAFVITRSVIVNRRLVSPLHRNRLAYLTIGLPFVSAYDVLELAVGVPTREIAIAAQVTGVLILSYAVLRHHLIDLRFVLRQGTQHVLITLFAIALYALTINAAINFSLTRESWGVMATALVAAIFFAVIFRPLLSILERGVRHLLFGPRYDVREVVQMFSQRLNARIDLAQLAEEGRTLLKSAMGARDAALLVLHRAKSGVTLHPLPARPDWPPEVRVDGLAPVVNALMMRPAPLLQYDIDRLPEFIDVTPDARALLRKFRSEVYVPIMSHESLIGVWMVGPKASDDRYTESDLALLATLADQSAVALENARLLSDLRDQVLQVRAMRDYLDSTLASIVTGVLTVNREGTIVSFNRAAEEIFQIPAAVAIGQAFNRVLPPMQDNQFTRLLARVWMQGTTQTVRETVTQVIGRGDVHLTIHMSPIQRDDETSGVALVVEDLTQVARLEEETRRVRTTFERYVPSSVVEGVLADPSRTALGGDRQPVTILFADLHGFTRMSEHLPPEELVQILNGYLSVAAQVILRYEGTLDKFLGDGVMAVFNAPLPQSDHAWRAACAALALQRNVAEYARQLPENQRLTFRVGIHTGEAVVGNIGTRELINYTAVGDSVNLAKRLQENAETGQIILSRDSCALIAEKAVVHPRETIMVKGRETPVEVFELIATWEQQ